ncbi:hypothetical protein [Spongiactinospora sp. TRM90649]|uniref:hypothetical protein n=1 Tax=Spongiactinospora sp. TRM90649 TaxID=3031114 RepID=UPI0023F87776|nr:hypothetical protein [Spongiactinospora sp. TRM90649]MDF5756817.1 hypothetical protein [Spongiactinospora sp. TRM90649]
MDVDEVRLLCDYASDYLEVRRLGDFATETFEELLLSIYPRKVIAPPESARETLAAARTLVDFLQSAAHVTGATAVRMRATLDRIEPEMPAALADTSRYGMAKSIFSAIGPEALDDPAPVTLTSERRAAEDATESLDEFCECAGCSPLPAVRLVSRARLAEAAREVPLLADVHRLADWMLAGGRVPTVRGTLRVKDAARARAELAVPEPALLWGLAVYTGVVEVARASATPGDAFAPPSRRDDDDLLDHWAGTVEFLVEKATSGSVTGRPALDEKLFDLCDMLYRVQAPVMPQVVADHLGDAGPEADEEGSTGLGHAVERLAYCGLVESVGGGLLMLTPLGVWGMRELYRDLGMDAPEAPDLAGAGAHDLIDALLSGVPAELAEHDIARWVANRTPQSAAADLLAAAGGKPAVARGLAVTIVDRLGAEAEPAVREHLADPELRPHAIHWLTSRGLPAPALTQEELLWMSVDMLALAMPGAGDDLDEFAANIAASGPPAHMIEEMWRVDHPDVVEVLDLLGRALTDDTVAKVARKAAFKARSRSIG